MKNPDAVVFATGTQLFVGVFFCVCFLAASLLADMRILPFVFPAALVAAATYSCITEGYRRGTVATALSLLVWAVAVTLCIAVNDVSCDGNFYHREQVFLLTEGWNPFRHNADVVVSASWVNHYPIGLEMAGAALMALTGAMESAKAVIPVLVAAMAAMCYGLISEIYPNQSRRRRAAVVLLVVCNPVIMTQLFTAYVDGVISCYIALTILLCVALISRPRSSKSLYFMLAAVMILAAATKFNALFYEALTGLCAVAATFIFGRPAQGRRLAVFALVVMTAAFLTVLYYPYISNWIAEGHPLYPLMGDGAIDIMTDYMPDAYNGRSRIVNVVSSILSGRLPLYGEFSGGFSAFFIILCPLSLIIMGIYAFRGRRFDPVLYIFTCILLSCFIFSQGWCARYVPQMWLIVPAAYVASWSLRPVLRHALGALGLLCGACCLSYSVFRIMVLSEHRDAVIDTVRHMGTVRMANPKPQSVRMIEAAGAQVVIVDYDSIDPDDHEYLFSPWMNGSYDISPLIELPPRYRAELDSTLASKPFNSAAGTFRRLLSRDE